ncbi:MAG: hypothetical protein PHP57_13410 [Sideroxydans sp.]|nr:hypothetical protein [Sideroxydans sp.]
MSSDDLLNAWAEPAPKVSPTESPKTGSDALLDSWTGRQHQALASSVDVASQYNPDKSAEASRLAKQVGLPVDTVERNQEEVARQARLQAMNLQNMALANPILARHLSDVNFAKVAHDDTGPLSQIESGLSSFSRMFRNLAAGATFDLSSGAYGLGEVGANILKPWVGLVTDNMPIPLSNPMDAVAGTFKSIRENQTAAGTRLAGDMSGAGTLEQGIASGFRSTGNMVPGLAASIMTGNPQYALGSAAALQGSQSATKALDQGVGIGRATAYGTADAAAEYLGDKLGVGYLLKDLKAGSGLFKTIGHQIMVEVPSEMATTAWQNFNEWALLHPEKTFDDYTKELGPDEVQTVIATITQSVLTAGFGRAVHSVANNAQQRQQAAQAEAVAQQMQHMDTLKQASALAGRDPASFEQFIKAATENGPVQDVYVDANVLHQAGIVDKLAEVSPSIAEQLNDATVGNSAIRIPLSEYIAKVAGTEYSQGIIPHLKLDPNGMSQVEAQDFLKNEAQDLEAQVTRELGDKQDHSIFKESQQKVKQEMLDGLNTLGLFTPEKNEIDATLYAARTAVRAAQMGMSPEEMHQKQLLKIQGDPLRNTYDQNGKLVTDTPEFKKWFGDSKVADADGKPLVVYHGTASDVSEFDPNRAGDVQKSDWGKGIYFTPNADTADYYRGEAAKNKDTESNRLFDLLEKEEKKTTWSNGTPKYTEEYDKLLKQFRASRSDAENVSGSVMPVYLNIKNPLVQPYTSMPDPYLAERAEAAGHDGIFVLSPSGSIDEIVAFHPTQIKSAIGNNGNFDPNDPNILHQSADNPDLLVQHNLTAANLLHADRMGGLPVPSVAITKKNNPLTGFGEITLLGDEAMADPKGYAKTQVFGADIYSPRYPKVTHIVSGKETAKFNKSLAAEIKETGASEIYSDDIRTEGKRALEDSGAVMAKFLKENGIEPNIVMEKSPISAERKAHLIEQGLGEYFGTRDAYDLMQNPEFVKRAIDAQNADYLAEGSMEDDGVTPYQIDPAGKRADYVARELARNIVADAKTKVAPDRYGTQRSLRSQIEKAQLVDKFNDFVDDQLASMKPEEKIFQGFTDSGNRKYTPHNLDNVIKILKKELRGGENWKYGLGSIRAKYTPQFKSLAEIRKNKGRLLDADSFAEVKGEMDNELDDLTSSLQEYSTYSGHDNAETMLYDAAKMGIPRALKENGFENVPEEKMQDIAAFLDKLKHIPTEYFEAKILRAVDLSEFKAAVVPEDTQQKVLDALARKGITKVLKYKNNDAEDRKAKINELNHLFFQNNGGNRGSYSPTLNTMSLLKNADLSTFQHELAHYFFENDIALATELLGKEVTEGQQQILDDVHALLKWHGLQGDIGDQLRQWQTMGIEEKRALHERTAESFEAYLFSGKAPSLELHRVFQTLRAYMVSVYRSLKEFLAGHPEAGKLNDEVRGVFDRMLATTEEIQLAEHGRSMMPLFASADMAGMSTEQFAEYHRANIDATQSAIEALQARGLKDMQWLHNAHSKEINKLKKQSDALRRGVEMQVRSEVMSQPVYRAWTFLTGKVRKDDKLDPIVTLKSDPKVLDPSIDSLFTAIAKLGGINRDEVVSTWGADKSAKPRSGLFGQPVWRATEGHSIDAMAELLAQHGYLQTDEHGKHDLHELEEKFGAEMSGNQQFSNQKDYTYTADMRGGDQIANISALQYSRLDMADLNMMGLPEAVSDAVKGRGMVAENGLHPDLVAETIGEFGSGDELVRALADAEDPQSLIARMTDQRMLEQHGELATPEQIKIAADQAIHNKLRAKVLGVELNALNAAAGERKILISAAKEFADKMIAKLRIKDIRPAQYTGADARAGKAAMQAMAKGDLKVAAAEKRNQIINVYAAKAAFDAQDEFANTKEFFKKVVTGKDDTLAKSRDMDIVNAARAVLSNFGYAGKASKANDYLNIVKSQDEGLYEVLKQSVDAAESMAKPLDELTMDELRSLRAEVESLWHLSKRSRVMEIDGDLMDRKDVAAELNARMVEIGIPDHAPGETSAITPQEQMALNLQGAKAILRRVESWVDLKDGSNKMGAFRKYIFTPIKEAADHYRSDKVKYIGQFRELFKEIAPTMKKGNIHSQELNYTFGKDSGGVAMNEVMHAILHTGNESNKRKLLLGRGWATLREDGTLDTQRWDAFVQRMHQEGKLTKAHYDFAQAVWDLLETTKPLAQKAHRDAYGKYFDEVTANEFDTPFGKYRGGYVPATPDSRIVQDADLRKLIEEGKDGMAFAFPSTNKGFTKGRVEYNRPLLLDMRTIPQHIDKVLLFSHMENPVRDAAKLIRMSEVSSPLSKIDPAAINNMLTPWLTRSARQQVSAPVAGAGWMMRMLNTMRNRSSMAMMMGNISNTVQQVTQLPFAALKVKPSHLASAMAQYMKNPKQTAEDVAGMSEYMDHRMGNEVSAMMNDIDKILLNPSLYENAQEWTRQHQYFLQSAVDNVTGPIVWMGAYNQALEEGYGDKDSIRIADSVVRQTQGSSLPEDVSRIETGPAYARLFTQFYNYFNMQANLLGTEFAKVSQEMGLRKGMGKGFYVLMMGFYAPSVVAEAIAQLFRGGPGDDDKDGEYLDDWLMALFVTGPVRNATAFVPFVGSVANSAIARFNKNPNDDKMSISPVVSVIESSAGVGSDLYKAANGEGNARMTVRDVATLISITTGLPASVAARPVGYLAGIAQDKIKPTGAIDATRGVITGTASPESKR